MTEISHPNAQEKVGVGLDCSVETFKGCNYSTC
jgi:phosphomevalonate kinase